MHLHHSLLRPLYVADTVMVNMPTKRAQSKKPEGAPTVTAETAIHPVVQSMMRWRHANGLSQRQAVAVMQQKGGLPLTLSALQKWEIGVHVPDKFASLALEDFLRKHPKISHADVHVTVAGNTRCLSKMSRKFGR